MNWNNIDLNSEYERSQPILDSYDCETLLLEVHANCREINHKTVKEQAMKELKLKYDVAVSILEANLDNLVKEAQKERAIV